MVAAVSVSLSAAQRTSRMTRRTTPRASGRVAPASSSSTTTSRPAASVPASAPQRRRPRVTGPLKGVVAMVDVRVGADAQIDCSDVVARKLRELGAATVTRLSPKLTHMVLSHFTPVWKAKIAKWQAGGGSMAVAATRYELKIVSQLWVNACYVSKKRMDERPFFPVSQQTVETAVKPKPKLKRRQSLGAEASKALDAEKQGDKKTDAPPNVGNVAPCTPPPASSFKINKALNGNRRKRRALSMEPMTSDAILKMLGTSEPAQEPAQLSTPQQPIRSKSVSSSAKRRRTLNGPPTQQDEDEVTASQVSGIVAESESENEQDGEVEAKRSEVIVIPDSQASQASPAPVEKSLKSPDATTGASSTPTTSSGGFHVGTPGDNSEKKPTARELRRRNRRSLSYGSGLTLKTGIWSCAACGCSNPRARKHCTDCHASRGSAKSPSADSVAAASPATVASAVADPPATSVGTSTPAQATPGMKTPPSKRKPRTPSSDKTRTPSSTAKTKTPVSSPSVLERTPRSITRATASSAAKMRTPSPAVSRTTRSTSRNTTPSSATRSRTQSPATRSSSATKTTRVSLASASVSTDVPVKKPAARRAQRKLPTTTAPSSAMKLTQSAAKKRLRPPMSSSSLTTPVVKKARRDSNKENTAEDKHMATPGSVSGFLRKHRDVNSTPIPMAMSFSSTTTRKTPRKAPRNVFGITGVSPETRGVLQCAIHAIDATMANEAGHRKARVVKSVDYAAGVTHLIVAKDARRTIKVLFAIARGAWIVTEDWAFSSLEQERWLPEEDFELTIFANKYAREHPELRQILKGMKFFVGSNVEPSREVLQSLIQVAGGEVRHGSASIPGTIVLVLIAAAL
jgi:hypothetical protein